LLSSLLYSREAGPSVEFGRGFPAARLGYSLRHLYSSAARVKGRSDGGVEIRMT
jgi:hypothetical protein